jgi:hypothetical protein
MSRKCIIYVVAIGIRWNEVNHIGCTKLGWGGGV